MAEIIAEIIMYGSVLAVAGLVVVAAAGIVIELALKAAGL